MLQFTANGKWAYFLDAAGANIYAYTRAGNGTLATLIDHYPVNGGSSLVIAPNSTFLYVSLPNSQNGQLATFSIDQSTGILSQVSSSQNLGYSISQLVMAPGGASLYGLAPTQQQVVLFSLSASSGVATFQGTAAGGLRTASQWDDSVGERLLHVRVGHAGCGPNGNGVLSPSIYAFNVSGPRW